MRCFAMSFILLCIQCFHKNLGRKITARNTEFTLLQNGSWFHDFFSRLTWHECCYLFFSKLWLILPVSQIDCRRGRKSDKLHEEIPIQINIWSKNIDDKNFLINIAEVSQIKSLQVPELISITLQIFEYIPYFRYS